LSSNCRIGGGKKGKGGRSVPHPSRLGGGGIAALQLFLLALEKGKKEEDKKNAASRASRRKKKSKVTYHLPPFCNSLAEKGGGGKSPPFLWPLPRKKSIFSNTSFLHDHVEEKGKKRGKGGIFSESDLQKKKKKKGQSFFFKFPLRRIGFRKGEEGESTTNHKGGERTFSPRSFDDGEEKKKKGENGGVS